MKPIYVVQINYAGLTGPLKMSWDNGLESYWSECGDFSYEPRSEIEGLEQVVFDDEENAESFAEGCRFAFKWINKWTEIV